MWVVTRFFPLLLSLAFECKLPNYAKKKNKIFYSEAKKYV